MASKIPSPIPFFLLAALFGAAAGLESLLPHFFFPALPPSWAGGALLALGLGCAGTALGRLLRARKRLARGREKVAAAALARGNGEGGSDQEAAGAGRQIARLVRNVDEDLREIRPDFSVPSLDRLVRCLPALLAEIDDEEGARIRLGIVGAYLGETACRSLGWSWFFRSDPALRRFGFLVSTLRKEGREKDPFSLASDLLGGRKKVRAVLEELR